MDTRLDIEPTQNTWSKINLMTRMNTSNHNPKLEYRNVFVQD